MTLFRQEKALKMQAEVNRTTNELSGEKLRRC